MCFDASQSTKNQHKEFKRFPKEASKLTVHPDLDSSLADRGTDYYHTSGFNRPHLLAFCRQDQYLNWGFFQWGLIPAWVNSEQQAKDIALKTLNARGESIFEKPSFRDAARHRRVLIPLDGFYEHHHKKGKKIPHYIQAADKRRLMVAGLASEWLNTDSEIVRTMSIVTCEANETMAYLHNNPKLKGPRMPLILNDEDLEDWLCGSEDNIRHLIRPNRDIDLSYHAVRPLRGKQYGGNDALIQQEYLYPETYQPPSLFD